MRKVVKFGGSSLASAEQFRKVGNIIRADKERKFVVPSAPGKRDADDTKVTDMLYACYDLAEQGKDFKKNLQAIRDRYQEIIDGLELKLSLEEEFKVIEKNFKNKAGSCVGRCCPISAALRFLRELQCWPHVENAEGAEVCFCGVVRTLRLCALCERFGL